MAAVQDARGPLRVRPSLALLLALAASGLLVAGPVGWRTGVLHYRIGLLILQPIGACLGIAAVAVAGVALVFGVRVLAGRGLVIASLALMLGAADACVPWYWYHLSGAFPRLNDVTTDVVDPPSLAFAETARQAERGNPVAYGGAATAATQRRSYPDIGPAILDLPPAESFEQALAVARAMGWAIVEADPTAGVIDADERSRWFGFTDDIAVRVTPAEGGSRVDIRSAARQGHGDFGVNAARVRRFLAALLAPAQQK